MPLCCASTHVKSSQRPALSPVRVESSLVLAMEPPAHALDGLPARDTTGSRRDGLPLDATVASPYSRSKS